MVAESFQLRLDNWRITSNQHIQNLRTRARTAPRALASASSFLSQTWGGSQIHTSNNSLHTEPGFPEYKTQQRPRLQYLSQPCWEEDAVFWWSEAKLMCEQKEDGTSHHHRFLCDFWLQPFRPEVGFVGESSRYKIDYPHMAIMRVARVAWIMVWMGVKPPGEGSAL